ncbi:MAG TPA: ABC transporter permease [Gammaproteobacteria bacterium]|nr:ABC transporter permease [Gammaproteobacteria bacterium]
MEQWLYRMRLLLKALFRRRDVEQELDDEIQYHLEQQVRLNVAAGMPEDDARRAARRAFGNVEARKEYCRDHWVVATIDRLGRDLRHAQRTLGRELSFTIGVLLLLALGIGANVAVFSIVDGVLLEPLPYDEPDRLMIVREKIPQLDQNFRSVNALHFGEWTACGCFEEIALSEYVQQANLADEGDPARVPYLRVTPNTFSLLGVSPQLGRTLIPDDAEPGGETNILISDRLWSSQFGSDPGIVGRTISFDAQPVTVVGVLPPGFHHHAAGTATIDIYGPWSLERQSWWTWTNNYSYTALARLADGVSPQAATDELNAIQAGIARENFAGDTAALNLEAVLIPFHDWVTAQSRAGLYLLLAAVAAAVTVAAMLVFGLIPALKLMRTDPERALETGGRSAIDSAGRMRGRQALVSAELALSVTLMIVAGLLVASFMRLNAVERGFDSTNVVTAEVSLPFVRYQDNDSRRRFWDGLRAELIAAPGVVEAGFTSVLPLRGNFFGSTAIREGEQPPAEEQPRVQYRFISEGYLSAIGVPLLRGRYLTANDYENSGAAVISERTARLLWGDENPLGRRFHWNQPELPFEVVGVVPDVPSVNLETEPNPIVYRPMTATGSGYQVTTLASIALRMAGQPSTGPSILRRAVASLDKDLALSRLQTLEQIESASVGERRFQLYLVGGFGISSLLIAALGIYSVLAYAVSVRHHELAMRMALGARRGRVLALVLRQGMRPVLVGIGLGVVGAIALGRLLSSLLFGVAPTDATTIATVVAVTLTTALLASVLPARRAAGTSVLRALRYE